MNPAGVPGAPRRGRIPRALGALLFLILLTAALAALQAGLLGSRLSPEGVREVVGALGWSAPFLFVAGYALAVNLMVPASLLAVGAGLAFGWSSALLLILAGCLLNFLLGYALSAALLRQPARTLLARFGWLGALERLERLPPVRLSFAARFIPIPVGAQNALLGLARLPIPPYLAGSLAGSLPWMIVFTGMGATAGGTTRFPFWLAALIGLGLMLLSDRWWSRRARRPEDSPTLSRTAHPARLEPGEPRLADWLVTSSARLLEEPLSGSMREDLFRLVALDRLGHHALVRERLYDYRRRQRLGGELRGIRPGAEDTPCALWSLVDHARLTGDVAYLKAVYGTVRRGARRLARRRLPDSSVPHSGLMPFPRGLPEEAPRGRYPLALWTLAGAQEAARAAAALGRGGDLHDFEAFFQELKRALRRSLEAHQAAGGAAGLPEDPANPILPADPERPADPEGPIDPARVDALLALLPGDLFPPDWEPLQAALEALLASGPKTALGRLVAAHHLLRRGDARVWDLLTSGTGSALPGSESASDPSAPDDGLADALRAWLVRNLLVSEAHDLVLVAPGFGLRAPRPGHPVVVARAPTRFGPLSFTLTPHPDGLELEWAGLERTPPDHFIWPLPAPVLRVEPPLATLTATRRAIRLEPAGGRLRVILGPA